MKPPFDIAQGKRMHTDTHSLPERWLTGWRAWVLGGGAGLFIAVLMLPLMYLFVSYLFGPAFRVWIATKAWWKWPAAIAVYSGSGFLLWRSYKRVRSTSSGQGAGH